MTHPTRVRTGREKQVLLPAGWKRSMTPDEIEAYHEAYHGQHGEAFGTGWLLEGLVVIDCDGPEAVDHWFAEIGVPTPYQVNTPGRGGGRHLYFRLPHPAMGDVLRGIRVPVGEGAVEVKTGWTSMVVVPPSPHPNGGTYEWVDSPLVDVEDAPVLPMEAVTWLRERNEHSRDTSSLTVGDGWDAIPAGNRNNTVTQIAGFLRALGAGPEFISQTLHAVNASDLMETDEAGQKLSRRALDGIVERSMGWEAGTIELLEDDPASAARIPLIPLDDFDLPDPPSWLWHPYIPENRLVLFDGKGGIGKGLAAIWLTHAVITGTDPTTGEVRRPQNALWLTAEDDPREDLGPRLRALGWVPGATPGRVLTPDVALPGASPKFPADIERLAAAVDEHDIGLIVMDPGRAFLGPEEGIRDFNFNNDSHVRPGLQALQRLAHDKRVAVLFIHHWNKDRSGSTEQRATGSASFNDVVRHRITVAEVSDEKVISVTKSNIARKANTVRAYHVEVSDIVAGFEVPFFVLDQALPEYVDLDAWEKAVRNQAGVEMVWGPDDLDTHLRDNGYSPPFRLPSREAIGEFLGISYRAGRELHKAVAIDPRFRIVAGRGGGLIWTAGVDSLEDDAVVRLALKAVSDD